MARALARGWGEPVLCSDAGSGRAARLVAEVGGEAVASNAELAERAELVILCHKPRQLDAVAEQVGGRARAVVSILAATPVADVRAAYPGVSVARALPNIAVEVRRGVVCLVAPQDVDPEVARDVRERFGRLGRVVEMEDAEIELATAVMSTTPAYVALLVEAHVDAAVKHGMAASRASELFVETLAGTAELLAARGYDTLAVRREVTSPGGVTARGLATLEAAGVRAAFGDALAAVLGEQRR
jgi:pyrroline-5-carboxylate reductase